MENLKFRALYKPTNKYADIDSIDFANKIVVLKSYPLVRSFGLDKVDFDDVVIEQSTGLKDKNGEEIYEGDIVKVRKISLDDDIYIAKIVFQEIGRLGFAFVIDYKGDDGAIYYGLCENNYIEVIGNIHENLELLKGETK